MLILLLIVKVITCAKILEHPEDVTVFQGDPATLQCRVSEGEVTWFKDGLKMRLHNNKNMVLFPDGSLFFLTTRNSDTGLYHCEAYDGTESFPAALIVGTKEEGIIPTPIEEEEDEEDTDEADNNTDIRIQIEDIPQKVENEALPLEVISNHELPNSVYIVSMIVVAILTLVIIIGAALIFHKIKKVNGNTSDCMDRESTAPMMYSGSRGVDTTDSMLKYPQNYNHYNYILHNEYDTPVHVPTSGIYKCVNNSLEKTSPTNSYHYASSNIIHHNSSRNSTRKYSSNSIESPKNNSNYFSC